MHEDRIRILNARLPTKRAIGHGLIRDPDGRVLLCELTYKPAWDLPGGVVEPHESPASGCRREVGEELGLSLPPTGLLAVNWMSPWRGWDDACTYLFDLGTHDPRIVEAMALEPREIRAVHWCTPGDVEARAAEATTRLLRRVGSRTAATGPLYLENGTDPFNGRPGAP